MKELRVTPIKNGTVIDHIAKGHAMKVLSIMGLIENVEVTVSVVMNVSSKRGKGKDIVKVEGKELNPKELNKIALVAPSATINIIKDYEVVKKYKVKLPETIRGIVRCSNPGCITNQNEPVETEFCISSRDPITLVCNYCEREMQEIYSHII